MALKPITKENFNEFYALLEKDFIFDERKTKEDELLALENSKFKPYFIYENDKLIGYFSYWEFDNFLFGEHFAIIEDLRDKGYGTKFLKEFLLKLNKPFVFEMEQPTDINSKRRYKFYKKLKFKFNKYNYVQPCYHTTSKKISMIFVSYPNLIEEEDYSSMVKQIKKVVYNP